MSDVRLFVAFVCCVSSGSWRAMLKSYEKVVSQKKNGKRAGFYFRKRRAVRYSREDTLFALFRIGSRKLVKKLIHELGYLLFHLLVEGEASLVLLQ